MKTESTLERLQSLLPEVFNPKPQTGDLYLRLDISSSLHAAIPLKRVVETLRLPAQRITPIPNMPPHALGLMESRNKIFWVLDLAKRLAIPQNRTRIREHNIVIVALPTLSYSPSQESESLLLGLSVHQIQATLRLTPEELNFETGNIASELQPYFQGWFHYHRAKTLLLNINAIASNDE